MKTVVVLAGTHGVGKTYHVGQLADALERAGVTVVEHHPAPPPPWCRNHWERALHYAGERVRTLAEQGGVIVAARWYESTLAAAEHAPPDQQAAMRTLAELEAGRMKARIVWVFLDAPDEVIDRRLVARTGVPQQGYERAEAAFLRQWFGSAPVFDTSGPKTETSDRILRHVFSSLELHKSTALYPEWEAPPEAAG